MLDRIAGVASVGLIGIGMVIGLIFMLMTVPLRGFVYLALMVVGGYMILMNYCRKCPHSMNGSCHHVLPGRIAKKLPYKKTGKYTPIELGIVLMIIAALFVGPLVYMYRAVPVVAVYLLAWVLGIALLRVKVCKRCFNRWCVVCPNRVK